MDAVILKFITLRAGAQLVDEFIIIIIIFIIIVYPIIHYYNHNYNNVHVFLFLITRFLSTESISKTLRTSFITLTYVILMNPLERY